MKSIGFKLVQTHHDSRTTIKSGTSFTDNIRETSLPSASPNRDSSALEPKDV